MEFSVEELDGKAQIAINENVSVGFDAAKIQNTIVDLIETGNKTIVVDLSNLNYITSWGIGILIYAFSTCSNKNVEFYVTGVNDRVLNIFKRIKVDNIIPVKES